MLVTSASSAVTSVTHQLFVCPGCRRGPPSPLAPPAPSPPRCPESVGGTTRPLDQLIIHQSSGSIAQQVNTATNRVTVTVRLAAVKTTEQRVTSLAEYLVIRRLAYVEELLHSCWSCRSGSDTSNSYHQPACSQPVDLTPQ